MCETEREGGGGSRDTHGRTKDTRRGGGGGGLSECVRQNETEGGEGKRHRE